MSCRQVQQDVAMALLTHADLDHECAGHVSVCPACAAEQASLRQVVAVMSLVTRDDVRVVEPLPAGDLLLARIQRAADAERAQERRHTRRVRVLAAAAAVILAIVGTAVGVSILAPSNHVITASASSDGVQATADIAPTVGGSEVRVAVSGLPEDTDCVVVVHSADGRSQTIASWRVEYEDVGHVVGNTTAVPEKITSITLTRPDGSTLLDIPVVA